MLHQLEVPQIVGVQPPRVDEAGIGPAGSELPLERLDDDISAAFVDERFRSFRIVGDEGARNGETERGGGTELSELRVCAVETSRRIQPPGIGQQLEESPQRPLRLASGK